MYHVYRNIVSDACDSSGEWRPLVLCGPHGLKFDRPVELRLPHTSPVSPSPQLRPATLAHPRHKKSSRSFSQSPPPQRSFYRPVKFRTPPVHSKSFTYKYNSTSSLVSSPTSYYGQNFLSNNPFADALLVNNNPTPVGSQFLPTSINHQSLSSFSSLSSSPTPNPAWALALQSSEPQSTSSPTTDMEPSDWISTTLSQLEAAISHSDSFEESAIASQPNKRAGIVSIMVDHF